MECPFCQTENPETRKFCRECAAKFELACLPGNHFFGDCGQWAEKYEKELASLS
jgi:hypothetical protein